MQINRSKPKGNPLPVFPLVLFGLGLFPLLVSILISTKTGTVELEKRVSSPLDHFWYGPTMEPKIVPFDLLPSPGVPPLVQGTPLLGRIG